MTLTIAWQCTQTWVGTHLGLNGNATPITEAARAVTQLSLFSGCEASAQP